MNDISKEAVDVLLQGVPGKAWRQHRQASLTVETDQGRSVASCGGYSSNQRFEEVAKENEANARFIAAARELVPAIRAALDEAEARATRAYSERTAAAVATARFAIMAGFNAGVGQDGNEAWDAEWRVVLYVDTPAGQVSWHIAPHDQHLLADLPQYDGEWDGTYRSRDGSFSYWTSTQTKAEAERDAANALLRDGLLSVQTWRSEPIVNWAETVAAHLGAKP